MILQDRWPGITYIEYSYAGKHGVREIDWCYLDKKILFNTDVSEAVILIQDNTRQEKVVLHSWIILFNKR